MQFFFNHLYDTYEMVTESRWALFCRKQERTNCPFRTDTVQHIHHLKKSSHVQNYEKKYKITARHLVN